MSSFDPTLFVVGPLLAYKVKKRQNHSVATLAQCVVVRSIIMPRHGRRRYRPRPNVQRWNNMPPPPATPSVSSGPPTDSSGDEEMHHQMNTNHLLVDVRFVKALTQEVILTHRYKMVEDYPSMGNLFAVVKKHLGNGQPFHLVLGKNTWKDSEDDAYEKILKLDLVADVIGAGDRDVPELTFGVMFVGKPGGGVGSKQFLQRSLRTTVKRSPSIRSV